MSCFIPKLKFATSSRSSAAFSFLEVPTNQSLGHHCCLRFQRIVSVSLAYRLARDINNFTCRQKPTGSKMVLHLLKWKVATAIEHRRSHSQPSEDARGCAGPPAHLFSCLPASLLACSLACCCSRGSRYSMHAFCRSSRFAKKK